VSSFLSNLVRRGAGLPPAVTPRPAVPSPSPSSLSAEAVAADPADRGPGAVPATADSAPDRQAIPGERTGEVHAARIVDRLPAPALTPAPTFTVSSARPDVSAIRSAREAPAVPMTHDAVSARPAPERPRLSHAAVDRDHDAIVTPAPVPTPAMSRTADNAPAVAARVEPSRVAPPSSAVTPQPLKPRPDASNVPSASLVRPAATPRVLAPSAAFDVAPAAAPDVQVRIGKVEIRASQPAAPLARAARPKGSSGFAELALARAHLNRNYR
jgi:hypothetical protein